MNEFSKQLRKYRTDNKITQDELASKLFVTRQSISKWESGDSTPDLNNLIKLADIFDVSLDTLVLGKNGSNYPDKDEYILDPKKRKYVRRYGKMNFWDFLSKYWWTIVIMLFVIGFFSIFH